MKPNILILICVFTVTFLHSQVKPSANKTVATKSIIVTYQESGTWGEWSGLIFIKDDKSEVRFMNKTNQDIVLRYFWVKESIGPDPNDVSGELHTNQARVGRKYLITYTTKKVKYTGMDENGAQTIDENVISTFELFGKNDFTGATCKVFQDGELKAVVFGDKMYEVNYEGEKKFEKTIQNKNEFCKGAQCIKVMIDKDGSFYKLLLPNTTDKNILGKLQVDQILKWEKGYQSGGEYKSRGIVFTGDRQQALMATLVYSWFQ